MALTPGSRLGSYEIIAPLGRGGMGEVYRARDSGCSARSRSRRCPRSSARIRERLARFEREARLLASLNHPNIAGIHGLEEADGARYLCIELVEGETLAERLRAGRCRSTRRSTSRGRSRAASRPRTRAASSTAT